VKKLLFLLFLAVALAGIVSAQDTAHPPGVLTLEAELSGSGVHEVAVTPDTVLVLVLPVMAELPSLQLAALFNDSVRLQNSATLPFTNTGQSGAISAAAVDYYLRC